MARKFSFLKSHREGMAYWRSVSFRRQTFLMLAAFSLFASIGALVSASAHSGPTYLLDGFAFALFGGCMAILYLIVATRKVLLAPLLIVSQILITIELGRWLPVIDHRAQFPPVPYETAVHVYAGLAMILATIAYTCFIIFIQTEGRRAIRAQTELTLAHGIQKTLVPVIDADINGCAIYGVSAPSEKVGGDLVDAVATHDGCALAYVADVAGHGLQAGILMGMVKTAARTVLLDTSSAAVLLERLNLVLPMVKEEHMYATCAALHVRAEANGNRQIEYAVAGHPPILLVPLSGEIRQRLTDEQIPLGLLPGSQYRSQRITVSPGDLIVLATDGILEVEDKQGNEFGVERLEHLVAGNRNARLSDLASQILAAVKKHGPQVDDQTLLLLRV